VATLCCLAIFAFHDTLFTHTPQGMRPQPWFAATLFAFWLPGVWWVYRRWKSGQRSEVHDV
jgi:hypothetical protein